jgi:hypothetical protein
VMALAAAVRDGALGRLTVERADGLTVGAHESPLAQALEAAGFRPTPRGLRLRAGQPATVSRAGRTSSAAGGPGPASRAGPVGRADRTGSTGHR